MGRPIEPGSADQSSEMRFLDSSTFLPVSVDHATTGLVLNYRREGGLEVDIPPVALAALNSTHDDGGVEAGSYGLSRIDLPDLAVGTGSDGVWVSGTATGIVGIPNYHPLNFLTGANIQSQVDAALVARKLHMLFNAAGTAANVTNDSFWAQLHSKSATADMNDYNNTIHSLQAIADKWLTAMTESYAADGAAPNPEQILFMIWSFLAERVKSGTTLTCKKLDGSTTSMALTLDDASNPTSITRSS